MRHYGPYILLVLLSLSALAREDTTYALVVSGAGGYTRNVSKFENEPPGLRRDGFIGTFRIMWKPEHLLSLGIETGFTHVYRVDAQNVSTEFGTTDIYTSQNAVPILGLVSMELGRGVVISGGIGVFLLYSESRIFGESTSPFVVSGGITAALAYMVPISHDSALGAEFKWYNMDKFNDNNLSLQVMFSYRLFEW
jgi:hypothetical protein